MKRVNEIDGALLRYARGQVAYGHKNSIVEWTLSESWSKPDLEPELYGKACIRIRYSHQCAKLKFVQLKVGKSAVVSGAFEVKCLDK